MISPYHLTAIFREEPWIPLRIPKLSFSVPPPLFCNTPSRDYCLNSASPAKRPACPSGWPPRELSAARPSRGGALRALGVAVATVLLTLAGVLLWPTSAEAQSETQLWSVSFTASDLSGGVVGCDNASSLSTAVACPSDTVTYAGVSYSFQSIQLRGSDGRFDLTSDTTGTGWPANVGSSGLTLDVNGTSLSFADAERRIAGFNLRWSNTGLTWTIGETVTLTITQEIPAGPSVDSIAFNSAGTDGAFKTDDAVTATVTFSESVTVDTTDGTPQLTIKMGGTDKVLDYSSGSPGTALVFSGYTVAANDEDTDGLSIEANKLDANSGTIKSTADATVAAVLTHSAVSDSANHEVDGVAPTLVTTGDDAPKTSVDGSKIILVFNENIASADVTKFTVKVGTTDQTISGGSRSGPEVELTLSTALSAAATNITVALAADAVTDVPGNGIAAVSATSVIRTRVPGAPVLTMAAKNESIDMVWSIADHGTSDITKFEYRIKETTGGTYTNWTATTGLESTVTTNTGGTAKIGSLTNGTEYTVQVRGVNSDGDGAESDAKSATPNAPPAVSSVAITSTPANASTYITAEDIVVTVTFDKAITLGTGTDNPFIRIKISMQTVGLDCVIGSVNTTLVCTGAVSQNQEDTDGISIEANALRTPGKPILGPLGQNAVPTHTGLAADSNHKVDGVKPTLSRADADPNDLTKIILTFSEAIGTVTQADITVKKGTTAQTIDSVAIDSTDTTKVVVTLDTALLTTDTNVTVDLDADAVKDVPGNGIAEVLGTSVSIEDNTPPTLSSAVTNFIGDTSSFITLQFNETIASTSIPASSAFAAKIAGTAVGVTSVTRDTNDTDTVHLIVNANPKAGDSVTVSYTKPGSNPLEDEAGNEVASFTDAAVTNNNSAPGKPTVTVAAKDASLEVTVAFTAHGTHNIAKYQYQVKTTGSFGSWTDSTDGVSNTGGTFTIGSLANGTEHTIKVRGVSAAGDGAESDEASGTPDAPPAITSVAITSDPGTDKTYIIDDQVIVTVTFDKNITLSGTGADPVLGVHIGTVTTNFSCLPAAPTTMKLECSVSISGSQEDSDGISFPSNDLQVVGKTILGPLGQPANLDYTALAADSDHKVDGVKPTLLSADADPNDLTKIILTFSEAIGTVDNTKITVKKGGTDQTTTGAAIDSTDSTKVEITLMTALLSTDTNITVDLAADAVTDVPGNGNAEDLATAVSLVDNTAPTFVSAGTSGTDKVVLTYDEALNTTQPATSAFTVKVGGNNRGVDTVAISGSAVTLTLASAFRPGDTLTVSYTKPGSNPIKDAADNEAVSLAETTVTNNLAATAPEAPSTFTASVYAISGPPPLLAADRLNLDWTVPWNNGSAIEKFQYRYAEGTSVPSTTGWTDVPDSAPGGENHTAIVVTGLDAGTEYTFEVRAVNGIGGGAEKAFTRTTLAPAWSFTLRDASNNNVTELTEGGDSATATVSITNNVRFGADQTVRLRWGILDLSQALIRGAGDATTITISAEQASGSLEISSPQNSVDSYDPPSTQPLAAIHSDTAIGSIQLTRVDDESVPVAFITAVPLSVDEGESIEVEISLNPPFGDVPLADRFVNFTVTDSDNALSGTLPTTEPFNRNQESRTITLTAAENTTQNDGAHDVTFALELNDDAPYTLGTPPAVTSVTITVRDDDTPPLAPENLRAQAGNTEATLTWQAPAASTPDHGQPVLHYEYRVKTTGSFGSWTRFPNSDADTRSHKFTGLTNGQEHTYQVRAVNVAGGGAFLEKSVTPIVGIAVSFGAATLSVDEGDQATVTVTLATAPAVGETVTVPIVATPGPGLGASEYSGVPANVVFNASETSKSFTVTAVQDTDDEPDRLLTFSLGTLPEGYVPGTNSQLVLTLVDDDHPIVSATFGGRRRRCRKARRGR